MKQFLILISFCFASFSLWADDVTGVDELLCSTGRIMLCVEDGECFDVPASEIDVPPFVLINTAQKTLSTTAASDQKRATTVHAVERSAGKVFMQGIDNQRAFSFVIEEESGVLTGAVAHHGITVSVFGACTNADVD